MTATLDVASIITLAVSIAGFGVTLGKMQAREKTQDERHRENLERLDALRSDAEDQGEEIARHGERLDGHDRELDRLTGRR